MEEILNMPPSPTHNNLLLLQKYEGKLISDMDFQKYLNLPKYLHCSELKMMQQSMNHWLSEKGFPETKALILGWTNLLVTL